METQPNEIETKKQKSHQQVMLRMITYKRLKRYAKKINRPLNIAVDDLLNIVENTK